MSEIQITINKKELEDLIDLVRESILDPRDYDEQHDHLSPTLDKLRKSLKESK